MNHVDYYRILNVSKSATIEQIKVAYRNLAKIYHPDLCTTDKKVAEATFKNLSIAYQVLSNNDRKAEYDRTIGNYGNRFSHDGTSKAWTSGRNPIRSPASGTSHQVTRDQFDVHMWNAYHYAEEDNPEGVKQEPVMNRRGWVDPTNKHQSYYRRKYARDWAEKNSGVKWSADTAYRGQTGSTGESTTERNSTSSTNSSSRGDPKRTYEKATAASFNNVEQQRQSAMENLQKSRAERVQKASNMANEPSSSCTVS